MVYRDSRTFFQLGGLTSDLKWGAEETLLLESLYFLVKIGGGGGGGGGGSAMPGI